ncbi:uncharacterized protein EKO05_0000390 [Ascochyta rabiei]|uniref:Uncharacterized protein n=1 Tax=Didymella rabiei TaxID=5454 RepID=A0A163BQ47_DIDRA|nr:uncharacterized protein EKO05_0000390 [Ascochyta rabiei]KZM21907.1 hypothetical protein ST47_g6928 [Ascochyta rabiei]UPX09706.1 hypothetical protein EKO05_0000390 [Ascochyta rabiei]
MISTLALALQLLITLRTISASPLPHHHKHAKRVTKGQDVGSGFAIAICVVILAGVFYYLGMRHERTRLWFSRRSSSATSTPVENDSTTPEGHGMKTRISCPLAVSSSAPIKPCDSPVEAPTQSLRYFELPIKEIHEMGQPSPRKPPPRASWLSLDRKPWWLRYPDDEEQKRSARTSRSKSMRSWFKSDRSTENVQVEVPSPSPVQVEVIRVGADSMKEDDKERRSDGSTLMDWAGLDYVRRIYVGRKSRVGL